MFMHTDQNEESRDEGLYCQTLQRQKILHQVSGREGCFNDVVISRNDEVNHVVILFPGDAQDFTQNMTNHRDNFRWKEYSLENTSQMINRKYPHACVCLVKASYLHLRTFACYRNFTECNMFGVPTYTSVNLNAFSQLFGLFKGICRQESLKEDLPVTLIGFNSGVSGSSGAWVTDKKYIQSAAQNVSDIQVHLTPYQIKDKMRPWINKEKKQFVEGLKEYGGNVYENMYFDDHLPQLADHFALLRSFEPLRCTKEFLHKHTEMQ
ncbi:mitochondrial protein C2orf69 homolog isoform X3 [Hydractinia symbiolongicarpus]|uniref:mitochondrial protein C2orf69 homolog isoform X3 n=1 Tax=Hydractinia symbiolongicarpus TaxID=13093 RepID=UPI00254CA079|nr:mitochondrial protein C2orf69 homolog isoform X3 [Hydractinia symbiolongicarpus]